MRSAAEVLVTIEDFEQLLQTAYRTGFVAHLLQIIVLKEVRLLLQLIRRTSCGERILPSSRKRQWREPLFVNMDPAITLRRDAPSNSW